MEEEKKKPNGGYSRLKVKYAKLEKWITERDVIIKEKETMITELQSKVAERDETIRQQAATISKLSADVKIAKDNAEQVRLLFEKKEKELFDHMGCFRRWLWEIEHASKN